MDFDLAAFSRSLVANAPDAIIYADADGVVRYWNCGAERLFGFSSNEALGQSLDLIIPETLRKRHWDGYARTMQTGRTRYSQGDVLAVPALRKYGGRVLLLSSPFFPFGITTGNARNLRNLTGCDEAIRRA